MNITILTGSPRKNGTSNLLADEFQIGALKSDNLVERFDLASLNINYCLGCNNCRKDKHTCIHNDDFNSIIESIVKADLIVFVTPIYYFDMSAQMKTFIDRLHSVSKKINNKNKKSILISTCANPNKNSADLLNIHYEKIINYLNWQNMKIINAFGVSERKYIETTDYPDICRQLGESIK